MEEKILRDYLVNGNIDIDKILDDFYGYVYMIVKNGVSIFVTEEDMEEIISDVFLAIWKNSIRLDVTTPIKPYLTGITKNIIKNKYRKTNNNLSLTDCEERLVDSSNVEKLTEEMEQSTIIKNTLKSLKIEEYNIFIMYYYGSKKIKNIAEELNCSTSKVKVTLHRVRKIIKRNLEDGGYSYGK